MGLACDGRHGPMLGAIFVCTALLFQSQTRISQMRSDMNSKIEALRGNMASASKKHDAAMRRVRAAAKNDERATQQLIAQARHFERLRKQALAAVKTRHAVATAATRPSVASPVRRPGRILSSLNDLRPVEADFCFPLVFTNKLYRMTPLFIASVKLNPHAQWILVHFGGERSQLNAAEFDWLDFPQNLQIVHTTAKEVQTLAEQKFKVSFKQKLDTMDGPKLNDWKPAFGVLFHDWIKHCKYWGYTDIDVIYGRLDLAIPQAARTSSADIISPRPSSLMGPFTLFKNTHTVNRLFFEHEPDWQAVLSDWSEEGAFGTMGFRMYDEQKMSELVAKVANEGLVRVEYMTELKAGVCSPESVQLGKECDWSATDGAITLRGFPGQERRQGLLIHLGYAKRHTEHTLTPTYLQGLIKSGFTWRRFDHSAALAEGMRVKIEPVNAGNKGKPCDTFTHLLRKNDCKHAMEEHEHSFGRKAGDESCPDPHATFHKTALGDMCFCSPGWCTSGKTACKERETTGDPLQDRWVHVRESAPWPHGAVVKKCTVCE